MTTAQTIPWKRITVEAFAIVVSILLAFAIDAWWDERGERSEEAEILLGLRKEFLLNKETLDRHLSLHEESLLLYKQLLTAAYSDDWQSHELDIDRTLNWLLSPTTTDIGGGVLVGLVNSGRIELLSSRTLREKLAGWEGVFGEVRDDEVWNSELISDRIIPYLQRQGVPLGSVFRWEGVDWPTAARTLLEDTDALSRLITDREFLTLVELRYGYGAHTTGEFQEAIAAADEILIELDQSISR